MHQSTSDEAGRLVKFPTVSRILLAATRSCFLQILPRGNLGANLLELAQHKPLGRLLFQGHPRLRVQVSAGAGNRR